jgi:hypothetical protein
LLLTADTEYFFFGGARPGKLLDVIPISAERVKYNDLTFVNYAGQNIRRDNLI